MVLLSSYLFYRVCNNIFFSFLMLLIIVECFSYRILSQGLIFLYSALFQEFLRVSLTYGTRFALIYFSKAHTCLIHSEKYRQNMCKSKYLRFHKPFLDLHSTAHNRNICNLCKKISFGVLFGCF